MTSKSEVGSELREHGPEREGGQGLDPNQYDSGDNAIRVLLAETPAMAETDFVATFRDGAYEVWSRRGMVRFKRFAGRSGLSFKVVEARGLNPIENQDPFALPDITDEVGAARRSGFADAEPNRAWIEPAELSYPHAYERIAQLFDSPRGPDLMVSPKCYSYGVQPGQHGALDVVQSRAPLLFAGPGVRQGSYQVAARHIDIAPTIARLMNFPLIDGRDFSGRTSSERGTAPDVYLKRQDGRVLEEILASGSPERVYLILLDGLSNSELRHLLKNEPARIPNIASLVERAAFLEFGSTVNFPSITWPSHSAILTGSWSGHHDIANPTYYERETRTVVAAQGQVLDTAQYLGSGVETLYEAFKRVFGNDTLTVSIHEPQSRGADHAAWEHRVLGDRGKLKALTLELMDLNPRWKSEDKLAVEREELVDVRGLAQALTILRDSSLPAPAFVAHELVVTDGAGHDYGPHHEAVREAASSSDRRIGMVLDELRGRGLYDTTLFVLTADHGMACQRVELRANPTCVPKEHGVRGVYAEPMIYLRDLDLECVRARDGRSLRIRARDNDRDSSGSHPAITGASVDAHGPEGEPLGEALTDNHGYAAIATPANLRDDQVTVTVDHPDFNSRRIRADGATLSIDLRKRLGL